MRPDRSSHPRPVPESRPNGLPCLVPECDGTPYNNCECCPEHQKLVNAFLRWLGYREFDAERERLQPRR